MKKINLTITGCMGRMGQQLIKSSKSNKKFKLVSLTENRIINKNIMGIRPNLNTKNARRYAEIIFGIMNKLIIIPITSSITIY